MEAIIQLHDVSKIYQSGNVMVPAIINSSLTINKGEMVAIMGPSGSGKSTLMNMIGLLDRPSTGTLTIDNETVDLSLPDTRLARLRSQKIGFVFQSFNLLPRMSALANVLVPASYTKGNKAKLKERALNLLKRVGLSERSHHKPTELSGGEKQRVAIARALINDPDIILADEPTGNLDSKSGASVLELLQDLNKEGKTIIIITHDPKVAHACQRTIHIQDGQVHEGGRHA